METGRINCFLDLFSTQAVAEKGLGWYQEKFESCQKIVIICTKQSRKTQENNYGESMFYENTCIVYRVKPKFSFGPSNMPD